MDWTLKKPEIAPQDYVARARRCFEAVKRFKALHLRLMHAMPSLTPEERRTKEEPFDSACPRYCTKTEKLDRQLEELYAQSHFEPAEKVLGDRKVNVANTMHELFDLIDQLGARL